MRRSRRLFFSGLAMVTVSTTAAAKSAQPVTRVQGAHWGFAWRFGGLATMAATGNARTVGQLTITQAAVKYVPNERWRIPIYAGTGLRVFDPDTGDSRTDWGIDLGAGFEYHFRIWRRISPFVGGSFGLGASDPSGDNNWIFGFGFGPQLGIEYFVADRLSLQAFYQLVLQFEVQDPGFGFSFATMAGGLLTATAYF